MNMDEMIMLARFKKASPQALRQLYNEYDHTCKGVLVELAHNANTPDDIKLKLAEDFLFAGTLLMKGSVNAHILSKIVDTLLAEGCDVSNLLHMVLDYDIISDEVFAKLLGCKYSDIRFKALRHIGFNDYTANYIARDKNTSIETLRLLLNSQWGKSSASKQLLASNKNATADFLNELIEEDNSYYVAYYVMRNENIALETWEKLVNSGNINIIRDIAENTRTPPEVLAQLANHKDPTIVSIIKRYHPYYFEKLEDKNKDVAEEYGRNCIKCKEFDHYADMSTETFICYKCR